MRVLLVMLTCTLLTGKSLFIPSGLGDQAPPALPDKALYERIFPHRNALYSYESFVKAAASFPLFTGEGDATTRKRELAAFFAHIAHETTNGWPGAPGGPYVWGLYYTEEQACLDGHCTQYNTGGTSPFKPVPGRSYFGRGPMQLTYAYNYGLAGEELQLPLLQQPELVSLDGVIAFRTALWFWMREQKPKPSCHEAICGLWQPAPEDIRQHRRPGFGMTIDIINGGVECAGPVNTVKNDAATDKTQKKPVADKLAEEAREERIGFYKHFASLLQVGTEKDCDCVDMAPYGK